MIRIGNPVRGQNPQQDLLRVVGDEGGPQILLRNRNGRISPQQRTDRLKGVGDPLQLGQAGPLVVEQEEPARVQRVHQFPGFLLIVVIIAPGQQSGPGQEIPEAAQKVRIFGKNQVLGQLRLLAMGERLAHLLNAQLLRLNPQNPGHPLPRLLAGLIHLSVAGPSAPGQRAGGVLRRGPVPNRTGQTQLPGASVQSLLDCLRHAGLDSAGYGELHQPLEDLDQLPEVGRRHQGKRTAVFRPGDPRLKRRHLLVPAAGPGVFGLLQDRLQMLRHPAGLQGGDGLQFLDQLLQDIRPLLGHLPNRGGQPLPGDRSIAVLKAAHLLFFREELVDGPIQRLFGRSPRTLFFSANPRFHRGLQILDDPFQVSKGVLGGPVLDAPGFRFGRQISRPQGDQLPVGQLFAIDVPLQQVQDNRISVLIPVDPVFLGHKWIVEVALQGLLHLFVMIGVLLSALRVSDPGQVAVARVPAEIKGRHGTGGPGSRLQAPFDLGQLIGSQIIPHRVEIGAPVGGAGRVIRSQEADAGGRPAAGHDDPGLLRAHQHLGDPGDVGHSLRPQILGDLHIVEAFLRPDLSFGFQSLEIFIEGFGAAPLVNPGSFLPVNVQRLFSIFQIQDQLPFLLKISQLPKNPRIRFAQLPRELGLQLGPELVVELFLQAE